MPVVLAKMAPMYAIVPMIKACRWLGAPWPAVACLVSGTAQVLHPGGVFCLYGPFNYHNCHTSPSNERFDGWL